MRLAVDTGGTFTDCVYRRNGRVEILKLSTSASQSPQAIAEALQRIASVRGAGKGEIELICGTTAGTNALLERRGARVALVTTAGFEDVIEIGRQNRPHLYDLLAGRIEPLVKRGMRFGVRERIGADGSVVLHLNVRDVDRVAGIIQRRGAESIAVCFLFSFANPRHERACERRLRRTGLPVSVSHVILPQFREYERTTATVVNAYLVPILQCFTKRVSRVARRQARGRKLRVRVMQSNGGIISAAAAAREPVRTVLSGPAGGVLGAREAAARAGFTRIITLDMGGTSTDVSLVDGELLTTTESDLAGLPIAVPMLDIHTVGAGGGSIARFDAGGVLRVGPESAGADPGPIAYGRGTQPTVTDAHVILGRLGREGLLGGEFRLDAVRARDWMSRALSHRRRRMALEDFAGGILRIAAVTMEKAIRVISVERGHDVRDYTLVAFGGAGGLQACELAEALRMPRVLIPRMPGVLSALGILGADVVKDYTRTMILPVGKGRSTHPILARAFEVFAKEGLREMRTEGFSAGRVRAQRWLEMRYRGQSYELRVPWKADVASNFHCAHEQRFGYADRARPVEVVNLRLRLAGAAEGERTAAEMPKERGENRTAESAQRRVWFDGRWVATRVLDRARLSAGARFTGPAIVTEYSATTVLPPGWGGRVDRHGNLILKRAR